jgi:ATP-binding cassette subfamily B protein
MVGTRISLVGIVTATSIVVGLVEAGMLTLVANIAATMVVHGRTTSISVEPFSVRLSVGSALLVALSLTFVRLILRLVVAWLPTLIAANVQAELRQVLFDEFTRTSWATKAADREGHFQELMTNQIQQAGNAVLYLSNVISNGAMFLALVAAAFSLSVLVAAFVLLWASVLFGAFRPLNKLGRAAAREASQAYIDLAGAISEATRLAQEAQVFGVTDPYRARLSTLISAARRGYFRQSLTSRLVGSLYQSIIFILIVGGIGGLYVAKATDLASLGAVVLILVRASSYGQEMQGAHHQLIQVVPYLERLNDSISRYRASATHDGGVPMPRVKSLAFDRVNFSYRKARIVLHDVSFEVNAGETIGIIGPTGAGKSTISHLLLRLLEPGSGSYLLNDVAMSKFSLTDWHRRVTYVPQEPRLFSATVTENIRFLRQLDATSVERAARLAHVHNEIIAMPAGYGTVIGQQADAVSGGQRQRICLARALAGSPEILLLDEPTSALDLLSEAAVEASLRDLHGSVTIFIIAHRVSILGICDRVLVLEDGRVSAFGPLEELARVDAYYRAISTLAAG